MIIMNDNFFCDVYSKMAKTPKNLFFFFLDYLVWSIEELFNENPKFLTLFETLECLRTAGVQQLLQKERSCPTLQVGITFPSPLESQTPPSRLCSYLFSPHAHPVFFLPLSLLQQVLYVAGLVVTGLTPQPAPSAILRIAACVASSQSEPGQSFPLQ